MNGERANTAAMRRTAIYWAVGLGLVLIYALLDGSTWRSGAHLHTIMETVATLLALVVGAMALVRYYSRKSDTLLLIGAGFLGTAFLDGYHALVTSAYFAPLLPSDLPSLIPWSWVASRLFLSVMLCLSWLAWRRVRHHGGTAYVNERTIYLGTAVLTVTSFLFFALVPLPRAYYPGSPFHRPEEIVPALFFLIALVGYLRKGAWRTDPFEHWLVLSLIVGFVGEAAFMSTSGQIFDMQFDVAHLLKKASYVCVLTGLLNGMYVTFRDAEQSGERIRAVVDNVVEAIITIDQRGIMLSFNPGAEQTFGYTADEVIGRNVKLLMPKPDQSRHDGYVANYLRTGEAKIIGIGREVTGRHKNGQEFPMELAIGEFRAGGHPMFVGVCRDISARKRAEVELRQARDDLERRVEERTAELALAQREASDAHERLTDAIESISEGFILYDPDERLVLCNSKYREFYPMLDDLLRPGTALADIVGASVEMGAIREAVDNPEEWLRMRLAQYRSASGSHEQRMLDGRWLLATERRTPDGYIVGIRTDITEIKAREAALHQAQKMEAVGQLTGGVAHDFNNLLTVIQGNLELIEEAFADNSALADLVRPAVRASERGAALTHRLLAFSRHQALVPKVIDMNELITGMSDLLRRTLGETIEIEVVGAAGLWTCEVDPSQMENALLNLAINARDAMPGGGKLTIETANARLDEDYAAAQAEVEPGQHVLLAVSDTGTGMPPEVAARAFDPFFTTKEAGRGSGLGLSMIYGFVKQTGGHAKIYSELDEGTTIKIYLPRSQTADAESQTRAELPAAIPKGEGEMVLVVEDDPDVAALALTMLGSLGYRSEKASSAEAALAQIEDGPAIDLLLTDVVLPGGMNGRELANEVRRRRNDIPVLYMSGYSENAIVHGDRLDQGVLLLQKPFTRDAFARKIRQLLDTGRK